MKETVAALLGLLLLAAPAAVQALSGDGYGYMINASNTNTITITNYTGPGGAVTIPTNINGLLVTSIGTKAFANLTNLDSVTIPGSITTIGEEAFYFCTWLTNATLSNGVTSIGQDAFGGCSSLTNVTIPGTVTTIGEFAFYYCTSLTSITIPGNVTTIGDYAFYFCTGLTSLTIPRSVTTIGEFPFGGCSSLTAITVDTNNSFYSSVNGVLFDKSQFTLVEYPGGMGGSYTIPGTVASIGSEAFEYCANLTCVTIPGTVKNIGDEAFEYCTGLTNATLSNGVTSIGQNVFCDCTSLTSVTIPATVTNIGELAFYFCTSLTSVYFEGNAPATVGVNVFYDDDNATVYYFPGTTGWSYTFWGFPDGPPALLWNPLIQAGGASFGVQSNQFGFNITGTSNIPVVVEVCTNLANPVWFPLQTVTLTNGLFYFSEPVQTNCSGRYYRISAPFAQCDGTLQVTITPPDAVSAGAEWQVDSGAWEPSGAMAKLSAGAHTVQFSNIAGWNTPSSQIVTVTNGFLTTATGNYTAQGGTLQVTITPSDAVSAGAEWQVDGGAWEPSGAMAGFSAGAHTVQFSNIAGWNTPSSQIVTVTNGFLTTATGNYTEQNSYPYDYTADAGVITITGYSGSGGAVTIPSTINGLPVASIGQDALANLTNLTSITIPATVTTIGEDAFFDCTSLTGVYFYGNAPSADATAFSGDNNATAYYLPGATGWSSPFAGLPALLWTPLIQASGPNFGVQSNQFGFNITWASGMVVKVEVCTNLVSPVWTPLRTNTLTNGLFHFSEAFQTNSPDRFYRISSQ